MDETSFISLIEEEGVTLDWFHFFCQKKTNLQRQYQRNQPFKKGWWEQNSIM